MAYESNDWAVLADPTPEAVKPPSVRPGWYPDVADGCQRYWDGTRWNGQVAPLHHAAPPARAATGDWIGGVIISLLLPLIGIIVGIVYVAKGGPKRDVGAMCLVLSFIAFVVYYALMAASRAPGYGTY